MIGEQAAKAGTGLAGSLGSWAISARFGSSEVAVVTAVSCAFGMLSSLARVKQGMGGIGVLRALAMNAGAVWLAAFVIASKAHVDLPGCVLIGLGVGRAGTPVLEVIETGVLAVARRLVGPAMVTAEELDHRLGDERNRVAAVFAEASVEKHKEQNDDD